MDWMISELINSPTEVIYLEWLSIFCETLLWINQSLNCSVCKLASLQIDQLRVGELYGKQLLYFMENSAQTSFLHGTTPFI